MANIYPSLSWDGENRPKVSVVGMAMLVAVASTVALPSAPTAEMVSVIVREAVPATDDAERLVERVGGSIIANLDLIGGFTATVPASALDTILEHQSVASATPDRSVRLQSDTTQWASDTATYRTSGSMYRTAKFVGVKSYWDAGFRGQGIDVALIDSGVVPVQGLTEPGKILNGPDLSLESQSDTFRYLDTFGHGTHMAGIIGGRDPGVTNPWTDATTKFVGIAPNSRIVSVKVAGYDGAVDVSQVLAAIDWVVQNRNKNGLNIRVLNLSFGTDSLQDPALDPLSYAVEQAWKAGIVVVVAAGNDGNAARLRMPATNRNVIAVGAYDTNDTNITSDDFLTTFTNCGVGTGRTYDVTVPGRSILSLRNPGSFADVNNPGAVVDGRLFKGSGTSQAAAVVSGAVALILSKQPSLNPNQVKQLMLNTNDFLGKVPPSGCPRKSMLRLVEIFSASAPTTDQTLVNATGLGSLELSRGTDHLSENGVVLAGEIDIFGKPFTSSVWAPLAAAGSSWSGGDWNGSSWSGSSWSGSSWSGSSWSGRSWSGSSWSGQSWSGSSWSGRSWSGSSWSGSSWSGRSWSGSSWSGRSWSGQRWE